MTRAGTLAALALAGTLITGAAAGYALAGRGQARGGVTAARSVNASVLFLSSETLLDSLRLSPAQRDHIDRVLREGSREADSILVRMRDDFRRLTRQARGAIRDTLSEAQRARFDSLLAAATPVRPRVPAGVGGAPQPPRGQDSSLERKRGQP